jgi:PAS domain S-box-containing protein
MSSPHTFADIYRQLLLRYIDTPALEDTAAAAEVVREFNLSAADLIAIHHHLLSGAMPLTSAQVSARAGQCLADCLAALDKPQSETGSLSVSSDITALRNTRDALQQHEQHYRILFDQLPSAVFLIASDGVHYLDANESAARLVGIPVEKLRDAVAMRLVPPNEIDDARAKIAAVLAGETVPPYERHFIRSDGRRMTGIVRLNLVRNPDGSPAFVQSIIHDITEQRDAAARLRENEHLIEQVMRTVPNLIYIYDYRENRNVFVNDALRQILGYTEEAIQAVSLAHFMHPDDLAAGRLGLERYARLTNSDDVVETEFRMRHADGSWRWLLCREVIFKRAADGEVEQVLGAAQDITERKRIEEELRQALENEREVSLMRTRFLSMASHEFRTPLSIIQSSADLLHLYFDRLDNEQREQKFDTILRQIRFMTSMLDDVLLIGRMETGRVEFDPQPHDLGVYVGEFVAEFQATQRTHHIHYKPPDTALTVSIDRKLFRQVLSNLLSNAVKYSPGSDRVDLLIERRNTQAVLSVRDYGIGIPGDEHERLFASFQRGSNVKDIQGTGLGLTIAKQAVDLHGGQIFLESQPGAGAVFSVVLPLVH